MGTPGKRRPIHHDWRLWAAVVLMLGAMVLYVLSGQRGVRTRRHGRDHARGPGGPIGRASDKPPDRSVRAPERTHYQCTCTLRQMLVQLGDARVRDFGPFDIEGLKTRHGHQLLNSGVGDRRVLDDQKLARAGNLARTARPASSTCDAPSRTSSSRSRPVRGSRPAPLTSAASRLSTRSCTRAARCGTILRP